MKPFISTKTYGVLNYAIAILLLTSPWFLGYYKSGGAVLFLPLLIGWLQLIMAIFSNNSHGFIKVFPMPMHMFLDVVTGSFLLASPLTYDFAKGGFIFWPHIVLGGALLIVGIFTANSPILTTHHTLPEGQLTSTDSE